MKRTLGKIIQAGIVALCLIPSKVSAQPPLTNTVSNVALYSLYSTSATFTWSIPAVSTPKVALATDSGFSSIVSSGAGTLGQTSSTFTALVPNTKYYFEVKNSTEADWNYESFGAGASYGSTTTLAAIPTSVAAFGVLSSSITIGWSKNNNASGVKYTILTSTAPTPSNPSGAVVTVSASQTSTYFSSSTLNPNTTYYFQVNAINGGNVATGFTKAVGIETPPAVPVVTGFSGITTGAVVFNWTTSPGAVSYTAQALNDLGTVVATSVTANTSATFQLGKSAFYNFVVAATNANGIFSAYTAALGTATFASAAVQTAPVVSAAALSSATIKWTWNSVPGAASYLVNFSTGGSSLIYASTGTQSFILTGLSSNTAVGLRVQVQDWVGGTTETGLLSGYSTGYTLAMIYPSSVAFSWNANTNPLGAEYLVGYWRQTSATAWVNPSTTTIKVQATRAVISGLNPGTSYYFAVQVLNQHGVPTIYSAATTLTAQTLSAQPPTGFAAKILGPTSMTWSWLPVVGAKKYIVTTSTGGYAVVTLPSITLFTSTNTAIDIQVAAANSLSTGPRSGNQIAYTYAGPDTLQFLGVYGTSVTVAWLGTATKYTLTQSGYEILGGMPVFMSTVTTTLSYPETHSGGAAAVSTHTFAGLQPNTTYTFTVQSYNVLGATSGTADVVISTKTRGMVGGRVSAQALEGVRVLPPVGRTRNPATVVEQLPDGARVSILGNRGASIRELLVVNNKAVWDGADQNGRPVPNGMYSALIQNGRETRVVKFKFALSW